LGLCCGINKAGSERLLSAAKRYRC
jgi:hypothetical protein